MWWIVPIIGIGLVAILRDDKKSPDTVELNLSPKAIDFYDKYVWDSPQYNPYNT